MTYPDGDGTALAALLDGDRMRLTEVGTPVTTTNRHDGELRNDDRGADGGGDFLGGLDAETDMALAVTNDDDGLEPRALTGTGLFLHRLDLYTTPTSVPSTQHCVSGSVKPTFITSSFNLGKKKSTIWYSLIGSECR